MKGMAMRRVLWRLDRIRTPRSAVTESDKEDVHTPPSAPLLAKRARQQTSSEGQRGPASSAKRTRQQSTVCDSPLAEASNVLRHSNRPTLGCVSFGKRRKGLVTLVVGKERQVFKVERQMLEHRLLECLLARTKSAGALVSSPPQEASLQEKENSIVHSKKGERPIRLDCDAILFEHILWLLNNDDPAIRQLNIEELMEFYE